MDRSPDYQEDIIHAWATPVSLAQLGAGLEAYAETKEVITTFRLAVKYTTMAALLSLPEEIISKIAGEVRGARYQPVMQTMVKHERFFTFCEMLAREYSSHLLIFRIDFHLIPLS